MADNLSTCKKCSQVISRESNCIGCEGFCTDIYHASCVNLRYDELVKYRQSRNLWWMCNSCSDRMAKQRNSRHVLLKEIDRKTNAAENSAIICIDDEIAALKKQISFIQQTIVNPTATSSRIGANTESPHVNRSAEKSSLEVLPDTLLGTKDTDCLNSIVEERSANERFWLFLTRIKNSVNEREVFKLVANALGTDDVLVKKLVPAWKDSFSMPFISFKVGINVRLKRNALLPSTWPRGLHFREFRNNYWEPLELAQ